MKKSKRLVPALGVPALVLVLISGTATPAPAEVKIDLGLNIPYYTGVKVEDEDAEETIDWLFLLPDAQIGWFQELDPVRVAPGLRLWTLIVRSAVYPTLTLERDVGPVRLRAGAGGGIFGFFGLYTALGAYGVFLPDLSVAYGFSEAFGAGAGMVFVFAPEFSDLGSFGHFATLFARYTITP